MIHSLARLQLFLPSQFSKNKENFFSRTFFFSSTSLHGTVSLFAYRLPPKWCRILLTFFFLSTSFFSFSLLFFFTKRLTISHPSNQEDLVMKNKELEFRVDDYTALLDTYCFVSLFFRPARSVLLQTSESLCKNFFLLFYFRSYSRFTSLHISALRLHFESSFRLCIMFCDAAIESTSQRSLSDALRCTLHCPFCANTLVGLRSYVQRSVFMTSSENFFFTSISSLQVRKTAIFAAFHESLEEHHQPRERGVYAPFRFRQELF